MSEEQSASTAQAIEVTTQSPGPEQRTFTPGARLAACGCQPSENAGSNGGETAEEPVFIYALGRIQARFPTLGIEKEFMQVRGRGNTGGQTDPETISTVLNDPKNRYLVHQMCWVFLIEGLETYLLQPRNPTDYDLLLAVIRPAPSPLDLDLVIGLRGPIAPPEMCNGLTLPIVLLDQVYSFDRDSLVKAIPKSKDIGAEKFSKSALFAFDRMTQMTDNAGATDEHRALNYVAVRYPQVYTTIAECHERNSSISDIEVRPSRLSGPRKIVDVIYAATDRASGATEKHFVRVDVSDEFPFLVSPIQPFFDR